MLKPSALHDPSVIKAGADPAASVLGKLRPAQGTKQGGDIGSQHRSAIYTQSDSQRVQALASREQYQQAMNETMTAAVSPRPSARLARFMWRRITTSNTGWEPEGYQGLGGIGVCLPPSLRNPAAFPVPVLYCASAHRQIGCSVRLSFNIRYLCSIYLGKITGRHA